jgi:hypothetical protein
MYIGILYDHAHRCAHRGSFFHNLNHLQASPCMGASYACAALHRSNHARLKAIGTLRRSKSNRSLTLRLNRGSTNIAIFMLPSAAAIHRPPSAPSMIFGAFHPNALRRDTRIADLRLARPAGDSQVTLMSRKAYVLRPSRLNTVTSISVFPSRSALDKDRCQVASDKNLAPRVSPEY